MKPAMFEEILEAPYVFNHLEAYKSVSFIQPQAILVGSPSRLKRDGCRLLLESVL